MSDHEHTAHENPTMEYATVSLYCSRGRSVTVSTSCIKRIEYCPMCGDEIIDVEVNRR